MNPSPTTMDWNRIPANTLISPDPNVPYDGEINFMSDEYEVPPCTSHSTDACLGLDEKIFK